MTVNEMLPEEVMRRGFREQLLLGPKLRCAGKGYREAACVRGCRPWGSLDLRNSRAEAGWISSVSPSAAGACLAGARVRCPFSGTSCTQSMLLRRQSSTNFDGCAACQQCTGNKTTSSSSSQEGRC